MPNTGGPLNDLNGIARISDPNRSVPVMQLIRTHKPKSKEELVELIKKHYEQKCSCGIVSCGTVEMFGQWLFDAQKKHWGKEKFTLQECTQWEYDLFVTNTLKGGRMEMEAIATLRMQIPECAFEETSGYLDEDLRIDILIKENKTDIGGIQVKPESYKRMRPGVISFNKTANEKWDKPVYYLYYDENEKFTNIDEIKKNISETKKSKK